MLDHDNLMEDLCPAQKFFDIEHLNVNLLCYESEKTVSACNTDGIYYLVLVLT